jgi:hypothetical protein
MFVLKRWVDPEEWGRFAWSSLYYAQTQLSLDDTKLLIQALPMILPCSSCRKGTFRFLEAKPLLFMETKEELSSWMLELQQEIRKKNLDSGYITKTVATLQGHFLPAKSMIQQNKKPKDMYVFDTLIFIALILFTCHDIYQVEVMNALALLAKSIDIVLPSFSNSLYHTKTILPWLSQLPLFQAKSFRSAFVTILSCIEFHKV